MNERDRDREKERDRNRDREKEGEKEKAIRKEKKVKETWSLPIQPHTQQEEILMIQPPPNYTFSIFHPLKVDVTKH